MDPWSWPLRLTDPNSEAEAVPDHGEERERLSYHGGEGGDAGHEGGGGGSGGATLSLCCQATAQKFSKFNTLCYEYVRLN
jgi:hypothetical protein